MPKEESDGIKKDADQKPDVSGDKKNKPVKHLERRTLELKNVKLDVLSPTFDCLHKIKRDTNVDFNKSISFLLDCGSLMYTHLQEKVKESIKELKKKNASD